MADPTEEEKAAAAAAAAQDAASCELVARLEAQLTQALETTRAALQTANPDLPAATFAADNFEALNASVTNARAIADHVRTQIETANPTAKPGVTPPAGAGVQRAALQVPENLRGVARIAFALAHPGPGMTE